MVGKVYIDLEFLVTLEPDAYLVIAAKEDLQALVTFSEDLVIRSWDGTSAVELESYGEDAVRTKEDASTKNNLENLPSLSDEDLDSFLG